MSHYYVAFDFGQCFIGVAVGQTLTRTARPLQTLRADAGEPRWEQITQLIQVWQPQAFVVGIPFNMDGTEQPITEKARQFEEELRSRYQLPVYTTGERLTTVEARARLFESGGYRALTKEKTDAYAAKLILEDWLAASA